MTRILARYGDEHALLAAARSMRAHGYRELEAYSPYPVRGIDEVLGRGPSRLPWAVFVVGISAAAATYGLEWLLNAYLYPINVGNRPPHYPLSYVPIAFEMGVLFAAASALGLVLLLARLPTLWHPQFEADDFTSASKDAFWLELTSRDPAFRAGESERELANTGAERVVTLQEVER